MRFLSVCSGIEAASVAWNPLGWKAVAFSEIEPFPCAVLAHHYPDTPNHGDMTKFKDWPDATIDLLCGGTPCQSFSVAGLRKGLDDPRGNLMLTFGAIAAKYRPRWLVWENVPGVLSSNGGRDFGSFLGLLGVLGYGFAYRILDAQYFGLAQRRKRVFVVGCLGDWRRAAAVLFERQSLRGDPAPRREAGKGVAPRSGVSAAVSSGQGWWDESDVGAAVRAQNNTDTTLIARDSKGPSNDGDGAILVPMVAHAPAIAFGWQNSSAQGASASEHHSPTLDKSKTPGVQVGSAVRRLTPKECARLQGFQDDYLDITYRGRPAADSPKYRALGNSWAVPVARWIGRRIEMVDAIKATTEAAA